VGASLLYMLRFDWYFELVLFLTIIGIRIAQLRLVRGKLIILSTESRGRLTTSRCIDTVVSKAFLPAPVSFVGVFFVSLARR